MNRGLQILNKNIESSSFNCVHLLKITECNGRKENVDPWNEINKLISFKGFFDVYHF